MQPLKPKATTPGIMSSLIQSEPDDSSTSTSAASSMVSSQDKVIEETGAEEKIPLSTSIYMDKVNRPIEIEPEEKISIRFQSIGSTPKITPNNFKITRKQNVSTLIKFMVKRLRLRQQSIYLYIQNSFQPTPDENLGELYDNFKTNNELIIGYCHSIAFG